jgi:hypothetical protein
LICRKMGNPQQQKKDSINCLKQSFDPKIPAQRSWPNLQMTHKHDQVSC